MTELTIGAHSAAAYFAPSGAIGTSGFLLRSLRQTLIALLFLVAIPEALHAAHTADHDEVQTAWRLLDYVAVDYSGAVEHGRIKNASEYAEMTEFAASVSGRLRNLPAMAERKALIEGAANLQAMIARKSAPGGVTTLAHRLAADLLVAYPVPLAPDKIPNIAGGAALFKQTCSACHGMTGNGHGPDAAKLSTPPIAFTDAARARQRSVFALYQAVTQGIDGTAMQSFADLPTDERWAVAFRAGSFAFSDAQARKGERLWRADAALRQRIPDLKTLATITPAALGAAIGEAKADAVLAFLRRQPDQVMQQAPGSLAVARTKLGESVAAARRGDWRTAKKLALSAYLDGFEPIEPTLTARDATVMGRIESKMGEYRAAIDRGAAPDDLAEKVTVLDGLFDEAEAALAPDTATRASTFVGAFTILLREGLEALLIVVAMIAFLRKAERGDALRYVHGGWIGALLAGGITWAVATYAIGISGACQRAPNFPQMWALKIPYAGGLSYAVISRIRDRVFLSLAGGRDALAVD